MFSICRTAYADVLLWHGDWERADEELTKAVEELGALRPGRDVDPLTRVAELRRRQGRIGEVEALLARVEPHRFHALIVGQLALDSGDTATALEAAARFLRRVGEADRFERVAGLDLLVRAAVAGGDEASARAAADEIAAIAAGFRLRRFAPRRCSPRAASRLRRARLRPRVRCSRTLRTSSTPPAPGTTRRSGGSSWPPSCASSAGTGRPRRPRREPAGRWRSSGRGRRTRGSVGSRRARPRCSGWSHADWGTPTSPGSSC